MSRYDTCLAFQLSIPLTPHNQFKALTHLCNGLHHPQYLNSNFSHYTSAPPSNLTANRPHRTIIVSSSSGNGVDQGKGPRPADVKDELIETLRIMTNDPAQVKKVEQSIITLESLKATPITPEFTEMALAGQWDLKFSSMRLRFNDKVRIREIVQRFNIEKKEMINDVLWSFPSKSGIEFVEATLAVHCSYVFTGPGRMEIDVKAHNVNICNREDGRRNDVPDDLQAVVNDLRLALPIEFFDPSGLSDISYIEPEFRIARFLGKRLAGVRNVFVRRSDR